MATWFSERLEDTTHFTSSVEVITGTSGGGREDHANYLGGVWTV